MSSPSSPSKPDTFPARVMRRWRLVLLGTLVMLFLVVSLLGGYFGGWGWVGITARTVPTAKDTTYIPPRTLWDWLQLLIVPAALAAAGYWFTTQQNRHRAGAEEKQRKRDAEAAERQHRDDADLARDKQREDALATYLARMSDLLLKHKLSPLATWTTTQPMDPAVVSVARALTLAVVRQLDATRNRLVLQFLRESGLIKPEHPIISFDHADLREANLQGVSLQGASLRGADLSGAVLQGADLHGANLSGAVLHRAVLHRAVLREATLLRADLQEADLSGADLQEADLSGADLHGTNLHGADLHGVDLFGVRYDNKRELAGSRATQWPDGFDPDKAGAEVVDYGGAGSRRHSISDGGARAGLRRAVD